ncbi:NOF-FB transposable element, partial [Pseudolycoriella hygida]
NGNKENWGKRPKRKTKKSKYLASAPNWGLNTNIEKKVKIGTLLNGNLSRVVYKVGKQIVALRNTCAFDSIAQIFAAAYAYMPTFRRYMEESEDDFFKLAIALAKNENMRKINTLRAKLLYGIFETNSCEFVSTSLVKKLFKHTPSYVEIHKCGLCKESTQHHFFTVHVENHQYDNDLGKLEISIEHNLPKQGYCRNCKLSSKILDRQFKGHILLELPSCGYSNTDVEPLRYHKLENIPLTLQVGKKMYLLVAAILFKPPILDGHYIGVVRINDTWEAYDDMDSKSRSFSRTRNVIIHNLLYIEME